MGRPCLTNHRKFRRLARALGSDSIARGCLEFMWDSCYENGDDYLGDSDDVESTARWQGEPGVLTKALLEAGSTGNAGFIEQSPDRPGHFHVHHLFDHAPEHVQKRMAREIERKKRGETISDIRRSAAIISHESRKSKQTTAKWRTVADTCAANVRKRRDSRTRTRTQGDSNTRLAGLDAARELAGICRHASADESSPDPKGNYDRG